MKKKDDMTAHLESMRVMTEYLREKKESNRRFSGRLMESTAAADGVTIHKVIVHMMWTAKTVYKTYFEKDGIVTESKQKPFRLKRIGS